MKRLSSVGLSLLLCTTCMLYACTPAAPQAAQSAQGQEQPAQAKAQKTIGRVIFDISHPYQQADNAASEAYCKENGYNYIMIDGKSDAATQANGVSDLIAKGVDGIIVQPLDGAAIQASVDEALAAKIPIVMFYQQSSNKNTPCVKIDEATSAFDMGAFAAQKWKEWYPDKPIKVAVIDQPDVAFVVENRSDAFVAGVKSVDTAAEIVARLDGKGVRDASMTAGEDLIQSNPDANIIFGVNADSALGALAAYESSGRGKAKDGIPLTELFVGVDGSEVELVKLFNPESSYKLTMALSAKTNGIALAQTAMKAIDGEIAMDKETIVQTQNKIIDFYRMSVEDGQKFLSEEFLSNCDLKKEIGLK